MELAGKVALVTGSTKGVGRTIAMSFSGVGTTVVVSGRSDELGHEVVDEIARSGGKASFVHIDVADEQSVKTGIDTIVREHGHLDILVNNAAAVEFMATGEKPLAQQSTEDFDYIIKVNLYGVFWCCKYAIPELLRSGEGAIINISSIASIGGMPSMPSYSSSKGAINALTRQLAAEYGSGGIRTNGIILGWVDTGESHAGNLGAHELLASAWDDVILTRRGHAEDIGRIARFLAAEDFLTGQLLVADGGLSSKSPAPDSSAIFSGTCAVSP